MAQLVGASSHKPKVWGFCPQSELIQEVTNCYFSLSLSLSVVKRCIWVSIKNKNKWKVKIFVKSKFAISSSSLWLHISVLLTLHPLPPTLFSNSTLCFSFVEDTAIPPRNHLACLLSSPPACFFGNWALGYVTCYLELTLGSQYILQLFIVFLCLCWFIPNSL